MPAVKRTKLIEMFWKVHPWLYEKSGGLIGGKAMGMPVLLLTTKGRKSGLPRKRALMYLPKGDACVVIASFAGEPRHPDWWLNLKTDPVCEVRRGRLVSRMRAREAEGAEREELWADAVEKENGYAEYQRRTTRRIPVVVLEPEVG